MTRNIFELFLTIVWTHTSHKNSQVQILPQTHSKAVIIGYMVGPSFCNQTSQLYAPTVMIFSPPTRMIINNLIEKENLTNYSW